MRMKKWRVSPSDSRASGEISKACGVSPFLADILSARGFDTPAEAETFLNASAGLSDPFLLPDMEKAAARIRRAIEEKEKIAVYGDYDCDGICAVTLLVRYLQYAGADVSPVIPLREEGYGLSEDAVERMNRDGVKLVITVDNGISAHAEADRILLLGMDLIITDHHQPGKELPTAAAVVDPHREDCVAPFRFYCGAGVALQLVRALTVSDPLPEELREEIVLLAAVATVGDIVPLVGENRSLVREGLPLIAKEVSPGISALLRASGAKRVSSGSIAYGIVPRINAAGRMGDPALAADLLRTGSAAEAEKKAEELNALNAARQRAEGAIFDAILSLIDREPERLLREILLFTGEEWDAGVIGIVCSRILERTGKPTFIACLADGVATGSARGPDGFSIYSALEACSEDLVRFGGHAKAGGFTVREEDLGRFENDLCRYASSVGETGAAAVRIDRELNAGEISAEHAEELERLQPFGEQNPEPVFLLKGFTLESVTPLSGGKHTKLNFLKDGERAEVLCFGKGPERFLSEKGMRLDLLVTMEPHEFGGRRSASLRIRDLRPADLDEDQTFSDLRKAERMLRRELTAAEREENAVGREDAAAVYRILRRLGGFSGDVQQLYFTAFRGRMGYVRFFAALQVLREAGLVTVSERKEEILLKEDPEKVSLSDSPLYRYLHEENPSV